MTRPFLTMLLQKIDGQSSDVFCHYYESADSFRTITFKELKNHLAERMALLCTATPPGNLLFILKHDVWEQITWWLSALLSGLTPGILSPPTPKLEPAKYFNELTAALDHYPSAKLVIDPAILDHSSAHIDRITRAHVDQPSSAVGSLSMKELEARLPPPDLPLISQQSSGTTGLQKGILLHESAVKGQLDAYSQTIGIGKKDVIVSWLPLYHDMGLVACLMQAVYHGLPLVITSPFKWLEKPEWLFKAIEKHAGTLAWLPNFAFNLISERVSPSLFSKESLRSLRLLTSCSEPILAPSLDVFTKTFCSIGLKPETISSSYAMAENTFAVTQSEAGRGVFMETIDRETLQKNSEAHIVEEDYCVASSGKAIPNVMVVIKNGEKECVDGEVGEIFIKSPFLMEGYFGIGEKLPVIDSQGWHATGDTGYQRNGELFVIGRKKDLIIRGGTACLNRGSSIQSGPWDFSCTLRTNWAYP